MQSKLKWIVAGIGIGLAFLWLAMRQADFGASWQVLRGVHAGWTLAVFAAGAAFMAVKSWRWSIILRPVLPIGFNRLHQAVYIGTAANLVVAHSGEILRATLVARQQRAASSAILATIAIERILDFIALVLLTGVALLLDERVSPLLWSAGLISLAFVAVGLLGVLAFLYPGPRLQRWGNGLLGLLPEKPQRWIANQLLRGVAGLRSLQDPVAVVKVIALSLLQWSCIVAAVAASAMAVDVAIPLSGAIAVFVLTVIGLTLPSSPAQLGTTQLAFVIGLELVGANAASAFAASLVYTCFVVVAMMVLGAICWMATSWSPPESTSDVGVFSATGRLGPRR